MHEKKPEPPASTFSQREDQPFSRGVTTIFTAGNKKTFSAFLYNAKLAEISQRASSAFLQEV